MNIDEYIVMRIEEIQKELDELKNLVAKGKGEIISLQGIWEGANITDEDIEEAKRSLVRKGIEFDQSS
jgi:hypothetical protein